MHVSYTMTVSKYEMHSHTCEIKSHNGVHFCAWLNIELAFSRALFASMLSNVQAWVGVVLHKYDEPFSLRISSLLKKRVATNGTFAPG